jgi:hypothetical protein
MGDNYLMASQEILFSSLTKDVETRPQLYLVADAGVGEIDGYIGVLFRHMEAKGTNGDRKELQESQFLMSSGEASELRELLDQALTRAPSSIHH